MSSFAYKPRFYQQPLKYLIYQSHNKPAYFYSVMIGLAGPAMFFVAPPIRRAFGDEIGRPKIPMTYPIPKGPRQIPEGYDDE